MIVDHVESTDGVEVAVRALSPDAPDDAPTILFCHATGFHGAIWQPVADALTGYNCVALDLRFHGETRTPAGTSHNWTGVTADVVAVADSLEAAPMVAVGWSLGGAALAGAAIRRSDLFSAALLYEPILFPVDLDNQPLPGGKNPMSASARKRRAVFASIDDAYDRYRSRPPFDAIDPAALRAYVDAGFEPTDDGRVTLRCLPDDEAELFDNWLTNEFHRLAELDIPVEVGGSGDGAPPAQVAELVANAIPRGHFTRFAELTHFGPIAAPVTFAGAVRSLANSVVGATSGPQP